VSAPAVIQPGTWITSLVLDQIFDNPSNPLEVDLGCGKGRFLVARAAKSPVTNFIGMDRQLSRIRKAEKKAQHADLENIRLLRVEIAYAVQHLLPKESVSTYYLLFPDPWPKRRHHHRRLVNPGFLRALDLSLVPGGCVHIATDLENYSDVIRNTFIDSKTFKETKPLIPDGIEQTEFEQIFIAKGLPIHRLSFKKETPLTP